MNNLKWSDWLPLEGDKEVYRQVPNKHSGIYRIRDAISKRTIYIGQTGRCLRERLRVLRKGVYASEMPFNDPHTAAPNLWVWLKEADFVYEFSYLGIELNTPQLQGLEDYVLWSHRTKYGCSALCNYGRFHPSWIKSSNRDKGRIGKKASSAVLTPEDIYNSPVLTSLERSNSIHWMRLNWAEPRLLSKSEITRNLKMPGIYRLMSVESNEVLYIGEAKDLSVRLKAHARNPRFAKPINFSCIGGTEFSDPCSRLEMETDLIGAFFEEQNRVPCYQYKRRAR
ncbi:GIY-YIG nuclease family protein [Vibrio lentus]